MQCNAMLRTVPAHWTTTGAAAASLSNLKSHTWVTSASAIACNVPLSRRNCDQISRLGGVIAEYNHCGQVHTSNCTPRSVTSSKLPGAQWLTPIPSPLANCLADLLWQKRSFDDIARAWHVRAECSARRLRDDRNAGGVFLVVCIAVPVNHPQYPFKNC